MDFMNPKDMFWFSVKLNPPIVSDSLPALQTSNSRNSYLHKRSNLQFGPVKNLLNISAEKLVSDVCLLRHKTCYLPQKIFSILLTTAIRDGRILSVVELMKHYPKGEFKILSPSILKNYYVNDVQFAKDELKKHYNVVMSVFSTFLKDIVSSKCCSSRLKILDLGSAPVGSGWILNCFKDFIRLQQEILKDSRSSNSGRCNPKNLRRVKEIGKKATRDFGNVPKRCPNSAQEYVLKCAIVMEQNNHLTEIKECFENLKSSNLRVIFSGICFLNVYCNQKDVQDLVNCQDLVNRDSKLLSIMFSDFNPRFPNLTDLMEKFKYLEYLKVCQMSFLESQDHIPKFFVSVSKLTTLKRLVLRDTYLTGLLSYLHCGFCQQQSNTVVVKDCCLAHSGSLKYLDISNCRLCYNDLKFLEQLSYSKSLKFLDISDNILPVQSTCRILSLLSSSLSVLHMAYCFDEFVECNPEFFPLSTFTELRVLKIAGVNPSLESLKMLYSELEKINLNILIYSTNIWVGCPLSHLNRFIQSINLAS